MMGFNSEIEAHHKLICIGCAIFIDWKGNLTSCGCCIWEVVEPFDRALECEA